MTRKMCEKFGHELRNVGKRNRKPEGQEISYILMLSGKKKKKTSVMVYNEERKSGMMGDLRGSQGRNQLRNLILFFYIQWERMDGLIKD